MKGIKRRRSAAIVIGLLACWLTIIPVLADPATPKDEEIRRILEKSLSVVEIDKEITRIQQEQQAITTQLATSKTKLSEQEQAIEKQRENAGKVLRAYYTGERDFLLTAIFNTDNLSELFTLLDYFDLIFSSDKLTLNTYTKQYRELKQNISKLDTKSQELTDVETRLKTQRDRVVALQNEVNSDLSGRSDSDKLRTLINEFTNYWQDTGIVEVRRYFNALSKAMGKMPGWIQNDKEMLSIDGLNYTLNVPEAKLNSFLREQNPIFDNFSFVFKEDSVIVSGKREDMSIELDGHYTLEKNGAILFHVDALIFNGLALPDTTRRELEREFDLGFNPSKMVPFLKTKSVTTENGQLVVKLGISF
ncbi:hypothetical protein [Paenibacillus sp. OV219]|uniref:coiled-coil domain-containing protein n=1 Tax=Paenibacillus sp. OV219 TaxID=1884377 RepID=UPI0008AEFFD2|nr:hypothetical protein [Paenibacillus sp. OV219]SEN11008.1 N-terminal domain of peptidoglycan hydrolase CwlO-containing protein [Paenibacillus sp. OV219]